jgi:DNA-binding NarL/FixJ family response regulator
MDFNSGALKWPMAQGRTLMTRKRVLVADDLTLMVDAVTALLRGSFDVVSTVSNGRAALTAILKLEPDLVVLDVSMPLMNGIQVAKEMRNHACKAGIVFLTGHQDSAILEICLEAGGLAYVLKDSMNTDLIPAMNEVLAGHTFISTFSSPHDTR